MPFRGFPKPPAAFRAQGACAGIGQPWADVIRRIRADEAQAMVVITVVEQCRRGEAAGGRGGWPG